MNGRNISREDYTNRTKTPDITCQSHYPFRSQRKWICCCYLLESSFIELCYLYDLNVDGVTTLLQCKVDCMITDYGSSAPRGDEGNVLPKLPLTRPKASLNLTRKFAVLP